MRHTHLFMPLALISAMAAVQQAYAADDFIARDIKFDGLVRLIPANVSSMLPIKSGDRVNEATLNSAIHTLYDTGLFDDIKAAQQSDGTLLFTVAERPVIAKVDFKGNKLIPKEALQDGLKKMGLAEGEVLKPSLLQNIETELEQQYIQQGRYGAKVTIDRTARPNNRVDLTLNFVEGKAAKVVEVNVVGNKVFSDDDVKQAFALKESTWYSILTRNDHFARERMTVSLDALRALYLNNGYVNFEVNSSDLNINDDKQKIFVNVSITEGQQFKVGTTKFLGDTLFKPEELKTLQVYKEGEVYSQEKIDAVKNLLLRKYGNAGYYFAQVNVVPQIDNDNKVVNVVYYINPGQQVTIRRINFIGNTKTADTVLRREMRQMEGALASNEKIDLSKIRLQRTGYFKTVDIKPVRIPGVPDQVDLDVNVEEQHSGTSTLAIGYSQSGGITYQAGISQSNFLGTGNSVGLDFTKSSYSTYYNLSVTDPYFTIDGVSAGYNVYYRETKPYSDYHVSDYYSKAVGASASLSYPIDENQSISGSLGLENNKVTTDIYGSTAYGAYLRNHGGTTSTDTNTGVSIYSGTYLSYLANLGWSFNTLDRPMFPTSGQLHAINLEVALPGSDAEYQKLTYSGQVFFPIGKGFGARAYGKVGYGHDLPFWKNFYAGGWGSVRGYEDNTLGPRYPGEYYSKTKTVDYNKDPIGGNALVQFGSELILPVPSKGDWAQNVRPTLFVEGGQTFDTECKNTPDFYDGTTSVSGKQYCKNNYGFDLGNLRYSAGIGLTWNTMIGPLSISYAYPLNKKDGDNTQNVQFQIGRTF
ncbi:outer membrane protein assembly factor BamA [Acinetobacter nectaris]|uniref:outer membrane protein assembly factor BamA n=1 Tax=Acinetobacter nectaris TaxID=1219382 RepID=UPI001F024FA2|nr:outer membrane protein assembly factor BamA [Acinetobacter nectaris]MCF8999128.1 outer membrane protein assembly factor BamA [Acinetobacter nectaris]MCF9026578.1 outer membrane protein assembly factor BamA [Acinetobacter nectaris]